jgi:hypothetical protein
MLIKILIAALMTGVLLYGFDFDYSKAERNSDKSMEVKWSDNIIKAKEDARAQNKPLMIVVYQYGCGACDKFKNDMESSNFVKNALRRYVLVALSIQNASHAGYHVIKTPTVFFETPEGKSLDKPMEGTPANIYDYVDYITKLELLFSEFNEEELSE